DDPTHYLSSATWLEAFGRPLLTFVEPTATGGQLERRVLFESGTEVDFSVVPAGALSTLFDDPETAAVIARGYRLLHDELALEARVAATELPGAFDAREPDVAALSHDFWYHALWAAKKLARGETYVAKQACDCYLKALLVELLAIHSRSRAPGLDTWHRGRFLERWAPPEELRALRRTYAEYDRTDVARAIQDTADHFGRLERELEERSQIGPFVDHDEVARRLRTVLEQ